jgi:2'-5' RNA ligase
MRTFIAIELSDKIKGSLAQIQSHLKYSAADIKWVEPSNIHLTLKFLGEIDEKTCEKVKSILDEIAKSTQPFEISLKDIGVFPNIEFPRVLWVGLNKGGKESIEIADKINLELVNQIGFNMETRDFAAHLTIGRVRSGKNKTALKEKIESFQDSEDSVQSSEKISSVFLFQSTLTPTGPVYTKLHEAPFNNISISTP